MDIQILNKVAATQAILGIGRSRVYELLTDGKLEGKKLGRSLRITGESIRSLLDSLPRAEINSRSRPLRKFPSGQRAPSASA